MDAGRLLRQARVSAGLTQAELARAAKTSQPAISAIERGDKDPSVATLQRLLRAAHRRLRVELSDFDDEVPPSRSDEERAGRLLQLLDLADQLPSRPDRDVQFPRMASR